MSDLIFSDKYMVGYFEGSTNAKYVNMQPKQAATSRVPRYQKIILIDDYGNEASQIVTKMMRYTTILKTNFFNCFKKIDELF